MKQEKTPSLKAVAKIIKDLTENKGKFKECIVCVKHLGNLLENSEYSLETIFLAIKSFEKLNLFSDAEVHHSVLWTEKCMHAQRLNIFNKVYYPLNNVYNVYNILLV